MGGRMRYFLVFICMISILNAASYKAVKEEHYGQTLGSVYYGNNVVMRLVSSGGYTSAYARAQMVAMNLNSNLSRIEDFDQLYYIYLDDIYTAAVDNIPLFTIRKKEIDYNSSTPEGLMKAWIGNMKRHVTAASQVQKKQAVKPPKVEKEIIANKEELADPVAKERKGEEALIEEREITVATELSQIAILKQELMSYKNLARKTKSYALIFAFMFTIQGIVLGSLVFLFYKFFKLDKVYGEYEQISDVNKMEELENSVSVLINELEDKSQKITREAKTLLEELTSKVEAPRDILAAQGDSGPETNEVPETEVPSLEEMEEPEAIKPVEEEESPEETPQEEEPELTTETETEVVATGENEETPAEEDQPGEDEPVKPEYMQEGDSSLEELPEEGAADIPEEEKAIVQSILEDESLNKQKKIMKLVAEGVSKDSIGKAFDIGIGEIDLIVELNR
jgi:hypothetical protein